MWDKGSQVFILHGLLRGVDEQIQRLMQAVSCRCGHFSKHRREKKNQFFTNEKGEKKINRERAVIFNLKPEELGFDLRVHAFLFSFTCSAALLLENYRLSSIEIIKYKWLKGCEILPVLIYLFTRLVCLQIFICL